MNRTGTAPGHIPVYSEPNPIDFVYHWLRIAWVEVLPGRLIDQSGDTCGWYMCGLRAIGYPASRSIKESRGHWQVAIEISVTALSHVMTEESSLDPDAVFELSSVTRTLSLTFDVAEDSHGFVVRGVELRPYSVEGAPVIRRYGGREQPYVWAADERS